MTLKSGLILMFLTTQVLVRAQDDLCDQCRQRNYNQGCTEIWGCRGDCLYRTAGGCDAKELDYWDIFVNKRKIQMLFKTLITAVFTTEEGKKLTLFANRAKIHIKVSPNVDNVEVETEYNQVKENMLLLMSREADVPVESGNFSEFTLRFVDSEVAEILFRRPWSLRILGYVPKGNSQAVFVLVYESDRQKQKKLEYVEITEDADVDKDRAVLPVINLQSETVASSEGTEESEKELPPGQQLWLNTGAQNPQDLLRLSLNTTLGARTIYLFLRNGSEHAFISSITLKWVGGVTLSFSVRTHGSITTVSTPEGVPVVVVMAVDRLALELSHGNDGLEVWIRRQGDMIPVKAFVAANTSPLGNVYTMNVTNAGGCFEAVYAQDSQRDSVSPESGLSATSTLLLVIVIVILVIIIFAVVYSVRRRNILKKASTKPVSVSMSQLPDLVVDNEYYSCYDDSSVPRKTLSVIYEDAEDDLVAL